jgi:DNA-binding response OmpR family regulator
MKNICPRILIVDDEKDLLGILSLRFSSWGFDVLTAANGEDAIKLVKEKSPDAVILDVVMPKMDGIQTLRAIRSFNKEIPVLMLTAYTDDENMKSTMQLGISGFIPKGPEGMEASQVIRTILAGTKGLKGQE